MNKIQQYKKYIWRMLQSGKWKIDSLLSKNNKTNNKAWNIAIIDAQKWAKLELIKNISTSKSIKSKTSKSISEPKPIRKKAKIDTETLEAMVNIEKRKKQIAKTKPLRDSDNFRSLNTFNKESYKRFIDEGIAGTRDDNERMRAKQFGTNSYNKQ